MNKILLTGGLGYIGSHTCVQLLKAGYQVVVIDNLSNSTVGVIDRIHEITGEKISFYRGDIRDTKLLASIFQAHQIAAVIHFAGLKAVGESHQIPVDYYDVNVVGSLSLLKVMEKYRVYNLVFSSSATVYGDSQDVPFHEGQATRRPTNPYGMSKLIVEEMLTDIAKSNEFWCFGILRYFNPIGAHQSGLIGENPKGIPNNLLPYVSQVALGRLPYLSIYGKDYPTHDGTGVRDYIHVVDLADAHLAAMKFLSSHDGAHCWNVGTGSGYSVLDIVHTFEKIAEVHIPYQIKNRRTGDIANCYASVDKAKNELEWQAKYKLPDMVEDIWRWQVNNPNGYQ